MTEASVTARLETNNPCEEVVVLECDDGETYISKKFGRIRGVQASMNEDTGTLTIPLSCAVSGVTITVHCTGLADDTICLTLYGDK